MQGIYKMSRIAEEDDTLDSFEVEGLVSSPVSSSTSPYSKRRGRQSYNGVRSQSSPRDVAKSCCRKRISKCWIAILILLGIVIIACTNEDAKSAANKIIKGDSSGKSDDWQYADDDESKSSLEDAIKQHMENNEPKNKPGKKDGKGGETNVGTDDEGTITKIDGHDKEIHEEEDDDGDDGGGDDDDDDDDDDLIEYEDDDDDDDDDRDDGDKNESNEDIDSNDKGIVNNNEETDNNNEETNNNNEVTDNNNDETDSNDEGIDSNNEIIDSNDEDIDGSNENGTEVEGDDEKYSDDYTQNVVIAEETEEEKEERVEALIKEWGKWHFWDGAAETRPTEDYLSMYPNKDCPYDGFPDESWQADAVYVNHMIDSALELVDRAKDAIFTEYGFGPKGSITSEQRTKRNKMFKLSVVDFDSDTAMAKINEGINRGGWTTKKSFHGLARRLLHAMMTNDKFTIVMAGNSAAAGRGNHFLQSYMAQFDYVMRPILERMGVELVTRNLANGDIGTISNALGSGSILGDNVDMIIWDSDLVNGDDSEASVDLFFRQALLAGNRPPVLVGPPETINVLKDLHENANGACKNTNFSSDL